MVEKLPWSEITKRYPDEWVELIDCEWDPFEPDPRNGVVRHHAKKRKDLHALIMQDQPINDAAVIYSGEVKFAEGTIFNANLHQYTGRALSDDQV